MMYGRTKNLLVDFRCLIMFENLLFLKAFFRSRRCLAISLVAVEMFEIWRS